MFKAIAISAILGCYSLFNTTGNAATDVATPAMETAKVTTGITMLQAPTPPPPYTLSVQFRYNGQHVGNKFKVVSADGCPIFTYSGQSGSSFENVLGVMFKSDCNLTRTIDVYYNDNGTWVAYQQFQINL